MHLRKWEVALLVISGISLLAFGLARLAGAQATAREGLVSRTIRPAVAFWGEEIDVEIAVDATTLPQPAAAVNVSPLYAALVIDHSGSMAGQPLAEARNAASDFVDLMNLTEGGDAATVVAFDDFATVVQPFSQDRRETIQAIQSLTEGGGTEISAGLSLAAQQFQKDPPPVDAQLLLILLSDGQSDPSAAIASADAAKALGLRVATVAFGDADRATLAQIASSPEDYYETTDPTALLGIYSDIAATVVGSVAHDLRITEHFNDQDFTLANQPYRAEASGNFIAWELPFVGRSGRSVGYLLAPGKLGLHSVSPVAGQMELTDSNNQTVAQPTPTGPSALVLFPVWVLFLAPALAAAWLLYRLFSSLLRPHRTGRVAKPETPRGGGGRPVVPGEKPKDDGSAVTHGRERPPPRRQ